MHMHVCVVTAGKVAHAYSCVCMLWQLIGEKVAYAYACVCVCVVGS